MCARARRCVVKKMGGVHVNTRMSAQTCWTRFGDDNGECAKSTPLAHKDRGYGARYHTYRYGQQIDFQPKLKDTPTFEPRGTEKKILPAPSAPVPEEATTP